MAIAAWEWPTNADRQRWRTEGHRTAAWSLWASRYEHFRLQGPKRSLLSLYNAERVQAGKPKAVRTPSAWDRMAKWGAWRTKAAQWDLEQLLQARRERDDEAAHRRTQARDQRRRLIEAGYALLLEALATVRAGPVDDTVAVKLLTAISRHVETSRKEYGDQSAGITREIAALVAAGTNDRERLVYELQQIRLRGWETDDLRLVLQTLEMEQELLGLQGALKLEHSGPDGRPLHTSSSRVQLYLPDNGRQPDPGVSRAEGADGDDH